MVFDLPGLAARLDIALPEGESAIGASPIEILGVNTLELASSTDLCFAEHADQAEQVAAHRRARHLRQPVRRGRQQRRRHRRGDRRPGSHLGPYQGRRRRARGRTVRRHPRDVPAGAAVFGTPARPMQDTLRELAALSQLPELLKQIKRQQREIDALRERPRTLEHPDTC